MLKKRLSNEVRCNLVVGYVVKRLAKDKKGSALVIAVMVMFVTVIFMASFVGSVATSTRIDNNAMLSDEAYLIAKSGLNMFEDGKSDAELATFVGETITGRIDGNDDAWFEIKVTQPSGQPINIVSTGHYGSEAYTLYRYADTTATSKPSVSTDASPTDKAANKVYGSNPGLFSAAVIGGPTMYLNPNADLTVQNGSYGKTGTVISSGNVSFASGCAGDYAAVYTKGILTLGHNNIVEGEVYAKAVVASQDSGMTIKGNVNALDYIDLSANESWVLGAENTVIRVAGNELIGDGYALRANCVGGGATLNGTVVVNGDVYMSNLTVNGDLYVNGNVICGGIANKISGTVYYTGDRCDYTPSVKISAEEFNNKYGTMATDIKEKLEQNVPNGTKPVTNLPPDGDFALKQYNSIEEIPTHYTENGKLIFVINESCTINFSINDALLGSNAVNNDRILQFNADDKKIDVYFTNDFKIGKNGSGAGKIQVFDHNHSGLVRFFFKDGIDIELSDVKPADGNSKQNWPIEPLNGVGQADADYVPNLYYFSLETKDTGIRSIGFLGNAQVCIPGYWLTPYLAVKTASSGTFNGDANTSVTFENKPYVHGMLTTDTADFNSTGYAAIKYYDPDWDSRNKWKYADAIDDVYKAPDVDE